MSAATPSTIRPALVRAARYRLLAHLLTPPEAGWSAAIRGLAREAEVEEDRVPTCSDEEALLEHATVFAPTGPVSACGSDHVEHGFAGKGPILADVAAFYRAFGYEPELREPPDHLATIFGFLSLLALKDAATSHEGDAEEGEVARRAEHDLLEEHVRPRLGPFLVRLSTVSPPDGAYRRVAALVGHLLDDDSLRRDPLDGE